MVRQWMCGVVMVAIFVLIAGLAKPAMAQLFPRNPAVAFWEMMLAEGGAIVGGNLALAGYFGPIPELATKICGHPKNSFDAAAICGISATLAPGRAIGAGTGAILGGLAYGIEGNILLAYLLPGLTLAASTSVFVILKSDRDSLPLVFLLPHFPVVPAVLAVIGFNIGAKMKDTGQPASLPWTLDLPVLSLEF